MTRLVQKNLNGFKADDLTMGEGILFPHLHTNLLRHYVAY